MSVTLEKSKPNRAAHYDKADLVAALRDVGVCRGQVVFSHSNIGYFGVPAGPNERGTADRLVLDAFQEVLGPDGTLVVPTFTYSFCKHEPFDPDNTPSTCGAWSELIRNQPGAQRSTDPIFSVAALGARATELTHDVPPECFGPNSFWDRLWKADGIICNLNVWVISTFIHYVEKKLGVPYRFDKLFPGVFSISGEQRKGAAIFFCQDLTNPDTRVATEAFDTHALESGYAKKVNVGRGYITTISARNMARLIEETLPQKPFFLTRAGAKGITPKLIQPARQFEVHLSRNATMMQMLEKLWQLQRDIVADGYDAALEALGKQIPLKVNEYPTGTHCWTWIVPEKWTCHDAWLETMDGKRLFSYAQNPLHVVSYSLPFEGVVKRDQLLQHLHVHPRLPDAIPYIFKYYERDWGLCCSKQLRDTLTDPEYRVVIRSDFSYGTLKVGEAIIPGESDETIVLCAHLCHPGQANDDLSGVIVGVQAIRELLRRRSPRYTYRLLILPETIGSVAWLSHNEHLIPKIKGGLFLEMLGRGHTPTLQRSFAGDTEIDLCFAQGLKVHWPQTHMIPFRGMNDERQFNSPGVRVPMLALFRMLPQDDPEWPFHEYHSSHDTPDCVKPADLEESVKMVMNMIDVLEQNYVPVNQYKGEVFLSRYGLHVDWYQNPEANRHLFQILYRVDGKHSIVEIARDLGISFSSVKSVVDRLLHCGLVLKADRPLSSPTSRA